MKHYALIACMLFALGAPSCQTSEVVLTRVASTEFRLPNEKACKQKAADDYTGGNIDALPREVSNAPLTYSFTKGMDANKEEMLYTVSSLKPDKITYYEVKASTGMSDDEYRQLAQTAFEWLLTLSKDIGRVQDPKKDEYETNKKFPYRAILTARKPVFLNVGAKKNKKALVQVDGDFGIIVNPPYPP